jgi:uncharacterized membrane protein
MENTPLAFFSFAATPYILSVLALGELVTDKLPKTPSRKAPMGFGAGIVTGALTGAAIGGGGGVMMAGLIGGVAGAVAGTLGGYEFRTRLVKATGGKDLPIRTARGRDGNRRSFSDRFAVQVVPVLAGSSAKWRKEVR